ncbi:nuclear transport factor 2 family protein [Maribacter sp. SA7]|uniref:nuclear transport factor 2 family protein n=1 Tax=Maribacter zhoushanensis TaxID=3030012 RepID=UPI0023EB2DB4|nr:nuclear transport factor 2 family protein [Maribacter zhoushanensis]MDF4202827.1 nuclear transport factor 2 family protein [Maribacter zhoushanensis]
MKYFALLLPFLYVNIINAQIDEEVKVKYAVETFFYALNGKNEFAMKGVVDTDVKMQTVNLSVLGNMIVRNTNFNDLINFMITTPDSIPFHEKILDYKIQIDGGMAHVWVPYEFWYNGEFSHCGVNSFQLFKEKDAWKIIYLVDSRRREDCDSAPSKSE